MSPPHPPNRRREIPWWLLAIALLGILTFWQIVADEGMRTIFNALSAGITNGDLFSHIIAFSPGFLAPAGQRGAPRIFISHGTRDEVLPIERCSRQIAPLLDQAGYDLRYLEFAGPHTVPQEIVREAVAWFTS